VRVVARDTAATVVATAGAVITGTAAGMVGTGVAEEKAEGAEAGEAAAA
jgi:hypothetical protein